MSPGPQLVVEEGGIERALPLASDRITIGQASTSDVVLTSGWVAQACAHIERIGGAHRVVASGGESGLLLRGEPIRDEILHHGDVMRLADPVTGGFVSLTYLNPLAPPIAPIQHFATPPGQALLTIGRSDADIVLDQPLVDRHHADLSWHEGRQIGRASCRDRV